MQRAFEYLNDKNHRVHRGFVVGLFSIYATALAAGACVVVDHQMTRATAWHEVASLSAPSTPSVEAHLFRQAVNHD